MDFNQIQQQLEAQKHASGPGEASTLDSTTQDGVDKMVQSFFKFFGINPDLKGHGVIPGETNVSSGLSMANGSLVKDKPGGVLATLFKYFTRDIPQLFNGPEGGESMASHGGGEGGGGGGGGSDGGDFSGGGGSAMASGGDMHSHSPMGGGDMMMPEMREYGGKLMASDPMEIAMSRLGELTPQATPEGSRPGLGADVGGMGV